MAVAIGKNGQGSVTRFSIGWSKFLVVWYLALGECETSTEVVSKVEGVKSMLIGKSFGVSRNWLAVGGAASPVSARFQMSKDQHCRMNKTQSMHFFNFRNIL
jgi:hypothetical protein